MLTTAPGSTRHLSEIILVVNDVLQGEPLCNALYKEKEELPGSNVDGITFYELLLEVLENSKTRIKVTDELPNLMRYSSSGIELSPKLFQLDESHAVQLIGAALVAKVDESSAYWFKRLTGSEEDIKNPQVYFGHLLSRLFVEEYAKRLMKERKACQTQLS